MTPDLPMTCHQRPQITAAMRLWLRRRLAMRAGKCLGKRLGKRFSGHLANPFLRLSRAVARATAAHRFRPCKPESPSLTIRISPLKRFAALGLGLAGGGGGGPGIAARS